MEIDLEDAVSIKKMSLKDNEFLFIKVLKGQETAWSKAVHQVFGDAGERVLVHSSPAFMTKVEVE